MERCGSISALNRQTLDRSIKNPGLRQGGHLPVLQRTFLLLRVKLEARNPKFETIPKLKCSPPKANPSLVEKVETRMFS
jgi:hypothetical protein